MVDILDMEDIFLNLIVEWSGADTPKFVKKLIKEISDFVEGQQTIECANCSGYKFKDLKNYNR